ncbi:MAG: hypothetical protein BroJett022_10300 [Actinomycetes bacterium]|nr:MAG: hypothetical protein BroJett022_10300 [Actinomycetes bacterium]
MSARSAFPITGRDAPEYVAAAADGSSAVRDWEIVRWIGRMGAVTVDQIRARFGLGRTAGYRRVAACASAGLVERVETLRGQPSLIRATKAGLRFTGLELRIAQVRPELVGHWIACGDVALALEREFGAAAVVSEREIRVVEADTTRPLASAIVGERPDGTEIRHRADLAVLRKGETVAIEVELTAKAPRRLEAIVRAWRRARWVAGVRYYVAAGVAGAVERAIARTHAADRVDVHAGLPPASHHREGEG